MSRPAQRTAGSGGQTRKTARFGWPEVLRADTTRRGIYTSGVAGLESWDRAASSGGLVIGTEG